MAISDIYNSLTFGGVNSLDYGIYISGPGVFDAPTRAVTFVDVPGRNGAIEIDEGHWNNIEVRYTAGTFGDDQSDFASKINAFRNAIVSQIGYQRITDTYNPEEYRLGIYASGLSVDPVNRNEAGEFELVFNCKPQRYLLEGEDEITVTSGDTIMNPTLYDSSPLFTIPGEGEFTIGNNAPIVVQNRPYGDVVLLNQIAIVPEKTFQLDTSRLNPGDNISIQNIQAVVLLGCDSNYFFTQFQTSSGSGYSGGSYTTKVTDNSSSISISLNDINIIQGTSLSLSYRVEFLIAVQGKTGAYPARSINGVAEFEFSYNAQDESITIRFSELRPPQVTGVIVYAYEGTTTMTETIGESTKSILSFPLYVDAETGQSYKMEGDEVVDLSRYISLGSDLPKISPGTSEILINGTATNLSITPRWWEL